MSDKQKDAPVAAEALSNHIPCKVCLKLIIKTDNYCSWCGATNPK